MGRKPKDLTGQKFGMLTVKDMTKKRDGRGSVYWHCVCDCGNEVDVPAARLIQGTCHSCGCLQKKIVKRLQKDDILWTEPVLKCWKREKAEEITRVA